MDMGKHRTSRAVTILAWFSLLQLYLYMISYYVSIIYLNIFI